MLRVEQVVDGQGADVNAFALGGARQRFDAARTRAQHGIHVTTGAVLWSSPPEVPLLAIEADTAGPHDLTFPACSAFEFEQLTGIPGHSNCTDIQREVQRHWGLGLRDQHDPLNLWLPTGVAADGTLCWWPVSCRRGDHVELRALTDVLVVVNPCASDLFGASPYELGPVRVVVRPARPGRPDPGAPGGPVPAFPWRNLPRRTLEVAIPAEHVGHVERVRSGGWFGDDAAQVVRALLLRWWEDAVARARRHVAVARSAGPDALQQRLELGLLERRQRRRARALVLERRADPIVGVVRDGHRERDRVEAARQLRRERRVRGERAPQVDIGARRQVRRGGRERARDQPQRRQLLRAERHAARTSRRVAKRWSASRAASAATVLVGFTPAEVTNAEPSPT